MGWVSPPTFHTLVAGLVGIAGLILAIQREGVMRRLSFLSWFHEEDSCLEDRCSLPGLQNLGNNCFLNVILQGLASCSHFQPFLQRILEETESFGTGEMSNILPLTDALEALLEELSVAGGEKIVLSPRKVMHEIAHYVPNFSLTSQQDAAEALLHLLSSLREESSECYIPNRSPLVLPSASDGRVHTTRLTSGEQKRWQKHFLGPFDGISGSILTCQSCSSQISLAFEFFHTLVLSPVLSYGSTIMSGCTLVDCLKQFTAVERVNNYRCCHCWHAAAVKYLSLTAPSEEEIEKVKACIMEDSCGCRSLSSLETLPWSNDFSRTARQTIIARSPKILCIQLQQVSTNGYGDLVKLKGNISFPLVLDLSPFISSGLGTKSVEEGVPRGRGSQQHHRQVNPDLEHPRLQIYRNILDQVPPGDIARTIKMKALLPKESGLLDNEQGSGHEEKATHLEKSHLYRLVSVVEHFGRAGSGHYTVFRSLRREQLEDSNTQTSNHAPPLEWFSISDSEVLRVSETNVLAAEASLLFYERIDISSGVNS